MAGRAMEGSQVFAFICGMRRTRMFLCDDWRQGARAGNVFFRNARISDPGIIDDRMLAHNSCECQQR